MIIYLNRKQGSRTENIAGFTVLEVVSLLVILGILAAVAVARYRDVGADDIAAANTLKTHLRYAQLRAMGDTVQWRIRLENDSYVLERADADGDFDAAPINLPGEDSEIRGLEEGVSLEPTGSVAFSPARGQPLDADGDVRTTDQNINVGTEIITITAETGFIP